ncbi:MAG TPA: cytochrome b [Steroidobacteraceae bacterium]|nr:cytochrome b [Steroidobacteraceae bacterium]
MDEKTSDTVHDEPRGSAADAASRYTRVAIALHWLVAVLLIGQIGFGWFLRTIPFGTPLRGYAVNLHKSTGLSIAVLILARILWRLTHAAPQLPSFMPAWERTAARWNQRALYLAMVAMPASGYIASNFSKYGVKLFNTVTLPPWGINDRRIYAVFNTTHVVTGYVLAVLILVHVFAAIRHAARGDGLFARIWPRQSARPGP